MEDKKSTFFKYFDTEKGKNVFKLWVVLLIEFIGTFLMVFEIIAPSSFDLGSNDVYSVIFGSFFMKAFWVSAFILLLIYLLRNISVNLNPAVTLSEVATGHHNWTKAFWMILIQFLGAFCASETAYFIANAAGTWDASVAENSVLDAIYPVLRFSSMEQQLLSLDSSYINFLEPGFKLDTYKEGAYLIILFAIEALYTFVLISSVIWGSKYISNSLRPLIIFGTLLIIITLGIHTNNIALNPARLMAPAISSQLHGGAKTLQFSWVFLFGELFAVMLVFYIESIKNKKVGNTVSEMKKVIKNISYDRIILEAKYDWSLKGNKPIEKMNLEELKATAKKLKIESKIADLKNKAEIENVIFEHLIFDLDKKVESKE